MKSLGVSFPSSALFTFENLPEHKLGAQQLNSRVVLTELNFAENVLAEFMHFSWCVLLS